MRSSEDISKYIELVESLFETPESAPDPKEILTKIKTNDPEGIQFAQSAGLPPATIQQIQELDQKIKDLRRTDLDDEQHDQLFELTSAFKEIERGVLDFFKSNVSRIGNKIISAPVSRRAIFTGGAKALAFAARLPTLLKVADQLLDKPAADQSSKSAIEPLTSGRIAYGVRVHVGYNALCSLLGDLKKSGWNVENLFPIQGHGDSCAVHLESKEDIDQLTMILKNNGISYEIYFGDPSLCGSYKIIGDINLAAAQLEQCEDEDLSVLSLFFKKNKMNSKIMTAMINATSNQKALEHFQTRQPTIIDGEELIHPPYTMSPHEVLKILNKKNIDPNQVCELHFTTGYPGYMVEALTILKKLGMKYKKTDESAY